MQHLHECRENWDCGEAVLLFGAITSILSFMNTESPPAHSLMRVSQHGARQLVILSVSSELCGVKTPDNKCSQYDMRYFPLFV